MEPQPSKKYLHFNKVDEKSIASALEQQNPLQQDIPLPERVREPQRAKKIAALYS